MRSRTALALLACCAFVTAPCAADEPANAPLTGKAAFGDWQTEAPGTLRLITPADLPPPYATGSAGNPPRLEQRPEDAVLKLPPGFTVTAYASDLDGPRQMKIAPNGDIFLAESNGKRIRVLRPAPYGGAPQQGVFADGLKYRPYGIAFYPPGPNPTSVYIATEGQVLRYPYKTGDIKASAQPDVIVPDVPVGHHWTRDIVFSPDGKRMLLAVGSGDNDGEIGMAKEERRADILDYDPSGHDMRIYASGIRNPVTLAYYPGSGTLWTTTNERDGLGDNLPPDYVTRVKPGGFYGWPWYYTGGNEDPRHKGERADLQNKVAVPDVLLRPHSAPLGMAFYTGTSFPKTYRGDAFVALHGSWNRAERTGYEVAVVPVEDGKPTGAYQDFMTGFVASDGEVWGRPVGIVVAADGALLVSDDGSNTVWRIAYGASAAEK